MKASLRQQFDRLGMRLQELDARLADPAATQDMTRYRELSREQSEASEIVELYRRFTQREADRATAQEMLDDGDADMAAMAREEIAACDADLESLEAALQATLLPRDPDDARPAFVEIRAGTGGEESALFAADLLRMYLRYAERQGWRSEVMSESASDLGGYKEVVVRFEGEAVYAEMKFESGGHRVQRVPATETQGRIHTSAATVAVMPEADDASGVQVNPSDVRVDTFRASGAGGQHVNKTDSAVRLTHLPTGIVVECQDARSQHKNREQAWRILAARIKDKQVREQQAKEAAERKSLVGSGDRSDRIRTYNFPQGRVTDHRINLTLHKIDAIMDGDLSEITAALAAEHQAEQLASLAQQQ